MRASSCSPATASSATASCSPRRGSHATLTRVSGTRPERGCSWRGAPSGERNSLPTARLPPESHRCGAERRKARCPTLPWQTARPCRRPRRMARRMVQRTEGRPPRSLWRPSGTWEMAIRRWCCPSTRASRTPRRTSGGAWGSSRAPRARSRAWPRNSPGVIFSSVRWRRRTPRRRRSSRGAASPARTIARGPRRSFSPSLARRRPCRVAGGSPMTTASWWASRAAWWSRTMSRSSTSPSIPGIGVGASRASCSPM